MRFLGKKEVFDVPIVGQLATALGGIRVDRGTGSDEPLQAAAAALEAGELVALMPQGTIPRGRAFFEPELKGRWGAARLAAHDQGAGHPDRPVGHRAGVAPQRPVPNLLNVGRPADRARSAVGRPVDLQLPQRSTPTRSGSWRRSSPCCPPEAHERHEPTAEELARTLPSGYKQDPDKELSRRPGTD